MKAVHTSRSRLRGGGKTGLGKLVDKANLKKKVFNWGVEQFTRKATELSMKVWGNHFAQGNRRSWEAMRRSDRTREQSRLEQAIFRMKDERNQPYGQYALEMALINKYL